jgi:glucose-1-phosphate cytidylyltransferase
MKVVLLAGGLGTRLAEETATRPKPMVEIGGKPILWHLMNIYAAAGYRDFIVACGYKGDFIKQYFRDLSLHESDLTIDLASGRQETLHRRGPDWRVTLIDTGLNTMTGGRLHRLAPLLCGEPFMVTYGDGLADVDVARLAEFHRAHGKMATVTSVRPPARFGGLVLEGSSVRKFTEKPQIGEGWINGGFFVFEPAVLDYLQSDDVILERYPLETLAEEGQLMAYPHEGFWQPMDTLREKILLEKLWESERPPWKIW